MSWKEQTAKAEQFEKRFAEKMPRTDDLTLIVLKGHLLIEEWINTTIDGLLPNPQALKAAQLDCFQRTRLLMAMLPDLGFHEILGAFEKLNAIRNKFGHMLEPPQINDRIATFIDLVERDMTADFKSNELPPHERLSRAISFLCGQLHMLGLFYVGASKLVPFNADYGEASI